LLLSFLCSDAAAGSEVSARKNSIRLFLISQVKRTPKTYLQNLLSSTSAPTPLCETRADSVTLGSEGSSGAAIGSPDVRG